MIIFIRVIGIIVLLLNMVYGQEKVPFRKNNLVYSTTAVYYKGFGRNHNITSKVANVGIGWYFRNNLSLYGNLNFNQFRGTRENIRINVIGIGGAVHLRWHFLSGSKWGAFLDYGPGILLTEAPFPPNGTVFNFMFLYGSGISYQIANDLHMILGFNSLHISNGKGIVKENPTFKGNGVYVQMLLQNPLLSGLQKNRLSSTKFAEYHKMKAQIETHFGSADGANYQAGELRIGFPVKNGLAIQLDAIAGNLAGETLSEYGLHAFYRSSGIVQGLYYGRKSFIDFRTNVYSYQFEYFENDLATINLGISYEKDNFTNEKLLAGLFLKLYFYDNLMFKSGLASYEILDDGFDSDDINLRIGFEWQPIQTGDFSWSFFAEEWMVDIKTIGIRLNYSGGNTLKEQHRTGFLSKTR